MTIRSRCVREIHCDVQVATYCLRTQSVDLIDVPSEWHAIPEGHCCPVCAPRLEEWRKRRGT